MAIVYQLKKDQLQIGRVQQATQTTENFGIEPTHGMFGSEEWWRNIECGALPLHTLKGKITKVYMGSMGDWPEFKMVSDAGEESSWTRMMHSAEQDAQYRVGAAIEIDFVWQHLRQKSLSGSREIREIIEVRIAEVVS